MSVKKRFFFLLVVVVIIVLCAFVAYYLFFRKADNNSLVSQSDCVKKGGVVMTDEIQTTWENLCPNGHEYIRNSEGENNVCCYRQDILQTEQEQKTKVENFVLGLGESKTIADNASVTLDEVNDSRCPQGVQCIQAGEIKVKITFANNDFSTTTSLEFGGSVNFDGWKVIFVDASPSEFGSADANKKPQITLLTTVIPVPIFTSSVPVSVAVEYINNQYGFKFMLPESWKDYSIVDSEWEGNVSDSLQGETITESGAMISIRHPQWTSENPRQDIPVMIFTLNQWGNLEQDKFHIGAAPINPSELGRNSKYVFALPARYNYAFLTGYEEVENILKNKQMQTF